jgi:hypothetical protein
VTKNRFGLLAAWLLATALAVGVASQAVGLVADRAVGIPVQVPVAVDREPSLGPADTTPADPATPTTIAPAPGTTTVPATHATTTTPPGGSTPTTVAATTTTVSAAPITTTTSPPLDSRTFFLPGGQVSVACTGPNAVALLSAVPVSGWNLDVESKGPSQVRVDFDSEGEESEIEVVCQDGRLREDISD